MIALPILIPLLTAVLLIFSTNTRFQKVVGVSGAFALAISKYLTKFD